MTEEVYCSVSSRYRYHLRPPTENELERERERESHKTGWWVYVVPNLLQTPQ